MPDQQQLLDFGKRRRTLRDLPCPSAHCKLLMMVLDDLAGDKTTCYGHLNTLVRMMCSNRTMVKKAIREARDAGYIDVKKPIETGRNCNTYVLLRKSMEEQSDDAREHREDARSRPFQESRPGTASVPPRDRIGPTQGSMRSHPGTASVPLKSHTIKHNTKNPIKPSAAAKSAVVTNTMRAELRATATDGTNGVSKYGGWGLKIDLEMLTSFSGIQKLYEIARLKSWISGTEADRLRFVAAACSVDRRSGPDKIQNPGGTFTQIIKQQLWELISLDDEDRAREAIKRMDSPVSQRAKNSAVEQIAAAFSIEI